MWSLTRTVRPFLSRKNRSIRRVNYSGVADGSAVTKVPYVALDITDKNAVEKVITEVNPDAVIHCAAWTAVDMAEDDDIIG